MRVSTTLGADRSGSDRGSGSTSNTSSAAPAIAPDRSAASSAAPSTRGPRDQDQVGERLHQRQLGRADQPHAARAGCWIPPVTTSANSSCRRPAWRAPSWPRHHPGSGSRPTPSAERPADLRHPQALLAQADHAGRLPSRPVPTVSCQPPDRPSAATPARPASLSHRSSSGCAGAAPGSAPGQLRRGRAGDAAAVPHTVIPRAAAPPERSTSDMPVVTRAAAAAEAPGRSASKSVRSASPRSRRTAPGADQRLRPGDGLGEHVDPADSHDGPFRAGQ